MDNPLISVIVPVYNVEKYLDRCVESIVNQTYTNLEIILVDDGSPDNCPAMCDAWAEKDNRIKVIHKENGGLSSARNAGLDVMTGEYVYFIDSDDYINEITISTLYNLINEYNAYMSFGRFVRFSSNNELEHNSVFTEEIKIFDISGFWNDYYECDLDKTEYSNNMIISCGKLMKSTIFSDLRFDVGKYHEDEFIIHSLVHNSKRIAFIDKAFYYYFVNDEGIMNSVSKEERLICYLEALSIRTLFFLKNNNNELCVKSFRKLHNTFCWQYDTFSQFQSKKRAERLYGYTLKRIMYLLKNEPFKRRALYFFIQYASSILIPIIYR